MHLSHESGDGVMAGSGAIFPGYTPPSALRDELERRRDFALHGPKAERQRRRILEGQALARQVLGALHVDLHRHADGVQMVDTLTGELIDGGPGERLPERFAALLHLAAREENHFVGQVLEDESGPWEMGGAAWTPSLRLDPNWMEVYRRRSRQRARAAVQRAEDGLSWAERVQRRMGWRGRLGWAMLTLTLPPVAGATLETDTRRAIRAFQLLRKRREWGERVRGAIKAVEAKPDAFHPHVHLHVLILARYWEQPAIRDAWGECLARATREVYGLDLEDVIPPIVDIRAVKRGAKRHAKPGSPAALDMEDALEEVVKYVTKPDDLAELHPSFLVDFCMVERWPRMFELLGACRERRKPRKEAPEPVAEDLLERGAEGGACSLDTACISAAEPSRPIQTGLFDEPEPTPAWPSGQVLVQGPPPNPPPKKGRPPTWRQLMYQLDLGTWLSHMWARAAACRRFRAKQLFSRFPEVVLWTLSGRALQHT
jgi:hypothetical protein